MSNSKKYIITSITLCAIGAVSAIAIAGTNLITKNKIEANIKLTEEKAKNEIFANAKFSDKVTEFKGAETNYLVEYYVATDASDNEIGYVYKTDGRNAYGEISMMVGITDAGIGAFSIITNTQSFASTLEDNYIVPIQRGETTFNDVSCGATYGAKLIKAMVEQANADYIAQKGGN